MKLAVLVSVIATLKPAQRPLHDRPPTLLNKTEPEHTQEALEAKLQGTVVLTMTIGTDGTPSDLRVMRALGKGLNEKAIECVAQWRFKPATHNGEPVSSAATIEVNFILPKRN